MSIDAETTKNEYGDLVKWIDRCTIESLRNELSLLKFPVFFCLAKKLKPPESRSFIAAFGDTFPPSFKPALDELRAWTLSNNGAAALDRPVFMKLFGKSIRVLLSEEAIQVFNVFINTPNKPNIKSVTPQKKDDRGPVCIEKSSIASAPTDNSNNLGYYITLALEKESAELLAECELSNDDLKIPHVLTPSDPDVILPFVNDYNPCLVIQKEPQDKRSKSAKQQQQQQQTDENKNSIHPDGAAGVTGGGSGDGGSSQEAVEEVFRAVAELEKKTDPYNIERVFRPEFLKKVEREYRERAVFSRKTVITRSLERMLGYKNALDKKFQKKGGIKDLPDKVSSVTIPDGQDDAPTVCMHTIHDPETAITAITFSKDATLVAIGMENSLIYIASLDVSGGSSSSGSGSNQTIFPMGPGSVSGDEPTFTYLVGHDGPVYGLSFSPDNRFLVSCSGDSSCKVWWLKTEDGRLKFTGASLGAHPNPPLNTITWGGQKRFTGASISTHTSPPLGPPIWDVRFSPGGFLFASAGQDNQVRVWRTKESEPFRMFIGHAGETTVVAFHPSCRFVASGAEDCTVRVWDLAERAERECVRVFAGHNGPISALAFSPDGRHLASADTRGGIFVWDIVTGSFSDLGRHRAHEGTVNSLEFDVDGCILAAAGEDSSITIWSITDRGDVRLQRRFLARETNITNVMFTRKNMLLAAGIKKGIATSLQPPPSKQIKYQ